MIDLTAAEALIERTARVLENAVREHEISKQNVQRTIDTFDLAQHARFIAHSAKPIV